jgi:eukaryotic-like serine/threonine-protein kinase
VFLVLELVAGETLAQRVCRGALPTRDAIDIARQIARAMEEAHEKGIVHRDLKPANVKLTSDGLVKVLDFGLAKALSRDSTFAAAPSEQMTREWMVVGTPAYMSPEQGRGGAVDAQTDIWAFGCVLFEMLTGVSAFGESTPADVSTAVLRGETPWTVLAPGAPPLLRTLVKSCLETNPRNRLRHIRDARLLLDAAVSEGGSLIAANTRPVAQRWSWRSRVAIGGLLVLGLIGGWALTRSLTRSEPLSASRFPTSTPFDLQPSFAYGPSIAVSPDGRSVVYALATGTTTMLYVKRLDELDARPIPGTQGARSPFFSPLGQWVGFHDEQHRKLKKVSLGGGEPVVIADSDFQGGAAWAPDDTILFATNDGLVRVAAAGGTRQPVTKGEAGQHFWPTLLPVVTSRCSTVCPRAVHSTMPISSPSR